jgi:hypothetical protein
VSRVTGRVSTLIMLHWKEFSAWVTIEGVEAQEYAVEVSEDEKTVTCWTPSELGKVPAALTVKATHLTLTGFFHAVEIRCELEKCVL